ncbi:FMN reductase [Spiribacter sp. 2438]|uniref:NADPH-dependent FMN reductase n=1 Tax=Spiribacter sp. 2438 TaxID=2666185 RepID=UPI0012AF3E64|nr:NAD(P)H-dependent oxidoreductase [Spiribacter sp. 2438]QGM21760.1 FMN reductase [Spiribacter sp. 2438]
MTDTPSLVFFAGSAREDSVNKKIARVAAATAAAADARATLIDLRDYPMPLYDGDLEEREGLPEAAVELKALLRDSDGFFIASPEYNSSLPPLLKNTIDWVSRRETADEPPLAAYKGKVAAIAAGSPGGLGGMRVLVALRMLLGNIGVHVVPQQLAIAGAPGVFDDNGHLTDANHTRALEGVVGQLVNTASALKHESGS